MRQLIRKTLNNGEEIACIILLAIAVIIGGMGVFWRYVLSSPFIWTEELSRLCMVWLTFIGMALGVKKGSHMYVDILEQYLSGKPKFILDIGILLLTAVFGVVLFLAGWPMVIVNWNVKLSASQWSSALFYVPLVLSGALIVVRTLINLIMKFKTQNSNCDGVGR